MDNILIKQKFTCSAKENYPGQQACGNVGSNRRLHYLAVTISDRALSATDGMASEVELRSAPKLEDARVGALMAAMNAERIAGIPSGRLFLDVAASRPFYDSSIN